MNIKQRATGYLKRGLAALGIIAVGIGAATSTSAAVPAPNTNLINIDHNRTGSITIHKHTTPENPDPASGGIELVTPKNLPVEGATFHIQKVTYWDAANPDHWMSVADLTPTSPEVAENLSSVASVTTDAQGEAFQPDLELGLYLVTEITYDPVKIDGKESDVVALTSPYLVTIPYNITNNPNGGTWNYDVHTYAKNVVSSIDKEFVSGSDLGDSIVWHVQAPVPGDTTSFTITDTPGAGLELLSVSNVTLDGVALPETAYTKTVTPTEIVVTLTDSSTAANQIFAFDVTSKLVSPLPADGIITNEAQVSMVLKDGSTKTGPKDDAQTEYGTLRIYKHGSDDDQQKPLSDAVFKLQRPDGTLVQDNITTNFDGTFQVPYLKPGDYQLVETTAPAGYVLDTTPINVTVVKGEVGVIVDPTVDQDNYEAVLNTKALMNTLPVTGGQILGLIIGSAIATGVGIFAFRKGQNNKKQTT